MIGRYSVLSFVTLEFETVHLILFVFRSLYTEMESKYYFILADEMSVEDKRRNQATIAKYEQTVIGNGHEKDIAKPLIRLYVIQIAFIFSLQFY